MTFHLDCRVKVATFYSRIAGTRTRNDTLQTWNFRPFKNLLNSDNVNNAPFFLFSFLNPGFCFFGSLWRSIPPRAHFLPIDSLRKLVHSGFSLFLEHFQFSTPTIFFNGNKINIKNDSRNENEVSFSAFPMVPLCLYASAAILSVTTTGTFPGPRVVLFKTLFC